ncbi:hypothetical protein AM493_05490 [Flavobacterium akiainvivens]|uniref:Fido domain-containing protein n=1 Tax=Flavobacterium akiainvivens TaxID=1202724 RepID=A0A0M8MH84_9FLAO|nr:Fic family protein [Flavobacterium akiainvivens]KOS05548.1 hypothetical protein AM493_05490 [Flavobacterium akiainvivens]SFQ34021.1 Fic/DOC family protein [Flavobacterium akiainvivens]
MSTEIMLSNWREGQTKAERLCANLLSLEGYSSIDPQSPLGGPDGTKDIICELNGWKYIGATYFPTTPNNFNAIKKKFKTDLEGFKKNKVDGIIFLTNQKITPIQRETLISIAGNESCNAIIYHVERIRVILDSPIGFGLRLEYLGISMSKEEQLSFFSDQRTYLKDLLKDNSDYIIDSIGKKIEAWKEPSEKAFKMVQNIYEATMSTFSFLNGHNERSNKKELRFPTINFITDKLTINDLRFFHKAILFETKSTHIGQLRTVDVWIGGNKMSEARFVATKASEISKDLQDLLTKWNNNYNSIKDSEKSTIIDAITDFHYSFLTIHPFLDGNGRIARFLLSQQVAELLKINYQIIIEDRSRYFNALSSAEIDGNLQPLKVILTQAIYGIEQI